MKIKNIFKKKVVTSISSDVKKLEKNQLSQINGGVDLSVTESVTESNGIKYVGGGGKAQGIM